MPNPNWWDECQVKCTCAWQVISGKLAPHLVEVEPPNRYIWESQNMGHFGTTAARRKTLQLKKWPTF